MFLLMLFLQFLGASASTPPLVPVQAFHSDSCVVPQSLVLVPNGRSGQDSLKIPCVETRSGAQLLIYNRWGQAVYQSENYANDWQGEYQGKALANGVYMFRLTLADGSEWQGSINLVR